MNDEVIIYWSPFVKGTKYLFDQTDIVSELLFFEPEQVLKTLDAAEFFGDSAKRCPAIIDELKKTFAIRAPFPYYADIDYGAGDATFKYEYDEAFSRDMIGAPNETRMHQLRYPAYLFFTEEPGLTMTQMPAYYTDNSFTRNTMILVGSFDISSWLRQVLPAFKFKQETIIDIKRGDIMMYYKFNTDKKIKLVQFDSDNHDTRKIIERCLQYKMHKERWWIPDKLTDLYAVFRNHSMHKRLIKIIKANSGDGRDD